MLRAQPLSIHGARIWREHSLHDDVSLHGARLLTELPAPDALHVDLSGYDLYPALINAHDHLELNHFPRTRFREHYDNAHQWGEDVSARLNTEPYGTLRALPLHDRVFIGGLKNLLCGALTVVQHNPPHKLLFHPKFPVTVIREYAWAHSLHFSSSDEIRLAHAEAKAGTRFYIHLAEGTDAVAAAEFTRLQALTAADRHTVIIHGVGLPPGDIEHAATTLAGLITCPTTNQYLLGANAAIDAWKAAGGRVALGSDSRLTAEGDLLDELRAFAALCASPVDALCAVWDDAAAVVNCRAGSLHAGMPNDWIAVRARTPLTACSRADVALIVRAGQPQIGDPDVMARFNIPAADAVLDGQPKIIHRDLAQQILQCGIAEPGLTLKSLPARRWFPAWRKALP